MEGKVLKTQNAQLVEIISAELAAAARAAREVKQRLVVVQKALLDVPQVVTAADVTDLYAASHAADALEQSLRSLRAHVDSATDETA